MSYISTDKIGPRYNSVVKIGPIAPPETDTDAINKLYVDTSTGAILPTFVSPLTYNVGPNSVTIDVAGASTSGYVSATAQTLAGAKTFTGALDGPGLNYEASNGWISGGTITYVPNGTLFSVSSVTARFTDYTNESHPVPGPVVTLPAVNNISAQFPTALNVGVYIDSTGAVTQDASAFNPSLLYSNRICLGRLVQPRGTIRAVLNSKYPVANRAQNVLTDFITRTTPYNITGFEVSNAGFSDLSVSISSGTVWDYMANVQVSRASPSILSVASVSRPTMTPIWRDNANVVTLETPTQQLDTTLYNPNASSVTLVAITAGYWVNIPIMYNPGTQAYAFQYPTKQYSTDDGAVADIGNFIRLGTTFNSCLIIIGYVTVQQGSANLSNALFSTGQFFGYGIPMRSAQLSNYTPIINKQSNTVFVDQAIGDDSTGTLNNRGRPYKTINAAIADEIGATNQNPYTVFVTPGKHSDPTILLPPHTILYGYNQRANLIEATSGTIIPDSATWVAETESALLTITNMQIVDTGFTADLRSIGTPPFVPGPNEWLSEIEFSFAILDGPLIYRARTVQDLFKSVSSDFEEDITIDGGTFQFLNSENDEGKTMTITAGVVDCVATINGATLANVYIDGNVSGKTCDVSISASKILGTLTVNGSNATLSINSGSLPSDPADIILTNGGQIVITNQELTTDEQAAIHANTTLAGANPVADVALLNSGLAARVPVTRTVNAKALSSNITITASDLTTGTLPVGQLPSPIPVSCLSTDTLGNNTTGSAYSLAVSSLLPDGTTAYTQSDGSNNTRIATCAYIDRLRGTNGGLATLDSVTGKVPDAQINLAGIGALVYKGTFDATTITEYPSVPPTVNGNFWIISVAGTVTGTGYTTNTYGVGDWMIFNGTDWEVIPSDTLTVLGAWTGSSNINTVGTITTGTWAATPVAATYGGVGGLSGIVKAMTTYATVAATSDYVSPTVDNTISADLTLTGTVLAPVQDRTDSSAAVATTSFVQSAANVPQSNIVFKSATGSDDRSGLTMNEAVLTFTRAMAIIGTNPSSSNQYVVHCEDASEDGPITLVPYAHLEATALKLLGHNDIGDYSYIHVKRIDTPGITGISLHFTGGTDPTSVSVVRSYKLIGGGVLMDANQGEVHVDIDEITGISPPNEVIRCGSNSTLIVKACVLTGKIVADGSNCTIDLTGCKDISGCTFERTAPADPTCRILYPLFGAGNVTGILKCDGAGNASAAISNIDYVAPSFAATLSGNITGSGALSSPISTTIANGAVTLGKLGTIPAASVIGNPGTSGTTPSTVGMTASVVADQIVLRDAQGSARLLHVTESFRTAAMDNSVYNLTTTDTAIQEWTGSDTTSTEDVVMPDATTVVIGYRFQIYNSSLGVITVKDAGGSTLLTLYAGESGSFICKDTGSTAGQWAAARQNVMQTLTGDVTGSGRGTIPTTIAANAITLSKLGTIPSDCVLGNISGAAGGPFTVPAVSSITANSAAVRDGSANILANNFVSNFNTQSATSTPFTLTVTSSAIQQYTGTASTAAIVNLPSCSSLSTAGHTFMLINDSGSLITIRDSAATDIFRLDGLRTARVTATDLLNPGTWSITTSTRDGLPLYINATSTTPFVASGASYTLSSSPTTLTAIQMYEGPASYVRSIPTVTVNLCPATTMYTYLTSRLGVAPPIGYNWITYLYLISNNITVTSGTGVTVGGSIPSGADSVVKLVCWITSATTYNAMAV